MGQQNRLLWRKKKQQMEPMSPVLSDERVKKATEWAVVVLVEMGRVKKKKPNLHRSQTFSGLTVVAGRCCTRGLGLRPSGRCWNCRSWCGNISETDKKNSEEFWRGAWEFGGCWCVTQHGSYKHTRFNWIPVLEQFRKGWEGGRVDLRCCCCRFCRGKSHWIKLLG